VIISTQLFDNQRIFIIIKAKKKSFPNLYSITTAKDRKVDYYFLNSITSDKKPFLS
jgi:hypothetical protein